MNGEEGHGGYAPAWQRLFRVSSYEVDPSGMLRPASLFNYLQETAGTHAEHLDLGYHTLRENAGMGFVLSRIHLAIRRMPAWEEAVAILTWPKRAEKLLALRDFLIFEAGDSEIATAGPVPQVELERRFPAAQPIVRVSTAWLLIDVERKRPVRPERNLSHIPINPALEAVAEVPQRLLVPDGPAMSEQTRVTRYSDIDQNDHVNNARYVEWITDFLAASAVPTAEHSLPAPETLTVNFTGEVKLGDQVTLRGRENGENGYTVWIDRDEQTAVIATFRW